MYLSNLISTVIAKPCVSLLHNVCPEFTSSHWKSAWLIFPALLINIRCHIVTVNTMANGNYGQIMNNFMGELPSPLGNTVSMTDLALAVLRHICLIACVWLTHSLWHIWMFHSVNYRELVMEENRFAQGFVWACVQLGICTHVCSGMPEYVCVQMTCAQIIYMCYTSVDLCTSTVIFVCKWPYLSKCVCVSSSFEWLYKWAINQRQ